MTLEWGECGDERPRLRLPLRQLEQRYDHLYTGIPLVWTQSYIDITTSYRIYNAWLLATDQLGFLVTAERSVVTWMIATPCSWLYEQAAPLHRARAFRQNTNKYIATCRRLRLNLESYLRRYLFYFSESKYDEESLEKR